MMSGQQDDVEMSQQAETSKAGAKRMRRLLSSPKLCRPSTAAIHPTTSHIIYPSPSPAFKGHLLTSLYAARGPRPLPTPQVLTPGRELSISPIGEWAIIFHPNPPIPNQASEGGTLAIYPSSILSPISTPTTRTTIPLATFPLPSDVLSVQHLYQPRMYLPSKGRAKGRGPSSPAEYESSQGPALVVLTPTGLILLHPQRTSTGQYMMGMLTCPLHTRWHAAPGGSMPPETGWRVEEGWMGLAGDDEGVWVGWGRKGEVGVIRAEVGVKDGIPFLRTTPMPPLPILSPSSISLRGDDNGPTAISSCEQRVQGMTFFSVPAESLATDPDAIEPTTDGNQIADSSARSVTGASIILRESDEAAYRTSLQVYGFERREVELVEGFNEIGGTGEGESGARSCDWFTMPDIIRETRSETKTNSTILALAPLPDIPPYTLSLAIIQSVKEVKLVHLDLCPEGSESTWRIVGDGISLDASLIEDDVELVPSSTVQRGLRGLVGVVTKNDGVTLVIMPSVPLIPEETKMEGLEEENGGVAADAAKAILMAIKQGVVYAGVVRSVVGPTKKNVQKEVASDVLSRFYALIQDELGLDDGLEIPRLQVSLFGYSRDKRTILAAELVKLNEASSLFNMTAHPSSKESIAFDLDTIWSLLPIAEWCIGVLADIFRSVVLYKGNTAWSSHSSKNDGDSEWSRLIFILHPEIRSLLVRILAQIQAFKQALEVLDEPILQPASRFMPVGRRRDPRATILAKERGRDLGVRDGVDIEMWGKALESIEDGKEEEQPTAYLTSYLTLDPTSILVLPSTKIILDALPSPSSLLLADHKSNKGIYDAIMFEQLQVTPGSTSIRCDRCSWTTRALGLDIDLGLGLDGMGTGSVGIGEGWKRYVEWRRERENGCGCGGSWVRETVSGVHETAA